MKQTKIESLIEAGVNIATGLTLAIVLTQCLQSFIGYDMPVSSNIYLSIVLTVASIIRTYLWRRFFNAGLHKVVNKLVTRYITKGVK